ncbi:MAG: glycosyltransferase [Patescibacteria group bacterium]|jgi:glycosyltransferase involved in cell wall biosynthesis
MPLPKVSIIIPIFNAQNTLPACLSSIVKQDYPDYEVILVDNNSTDSTKSIIEKFQKDDPRIKYFFASCQGTGSARNLGEKNADGEIILMTDADCVLPPDWVKRIIEPIFAGLADAVSGSEENGEKNFWCRQTQLRISKRADWIKKIQPQKIIGVIDTKNFAISAEALKKIGGTNPKYDGGTDTELAIRFAKSKLELKWLPEIKVCHHHAGDLKTVFKKYYHRAYWCTIVTKDHYDYLSRTEFLKETNQTAWSFVKIFPGLVKSAVLFGPAYAYFDLVSGLAWRLGILKGKIYELKSSWNKFKNLLTGKT